MDALDVSQVRCDEGPRQLHGLRREAPRLLPPIRSCSDLFLLIVNTSLSM